ncbi:zinc finger protein 181-like [Mugil cephalus]|uniref:zinc finger protein 181-like n=1 Tax=Mugil cephalus TaxID=48193 RepID=UPI001FB73251|nr:zinc finger protein 181-like [Mugil cephalus]
MMSSAVEFHSQIASIMEALANAAVAEICKVVDDGYALVNVEMSRSQKENDILRRRIRLLELQVSRYRAEQSRFSAGLRLPLSRQSRDPQAGSSLQGRTRFLNRGSGTHQSVQKTSPIHLDQDSDQNVVTTTKTESAEVEEDSGLLIVKVEGAVESGPRDLQAPVDLLVGGGGGGADAATLLPATSEDGGGGGGLSATRSGKTEDEENSSSPQCWEEKMDEVQVFSSKDHSSSQWQQVGDTEQPSCSVYDAANSSLSRDATKSVSGFTAASQTPQASDLDFTAINFRPGNDRTDEAAPLLGASSRYRQGEDPGDCVMFDGSSAFGGCVSTFSGLPGDSRDQQTQDLLPRNQHTENLSSQNQPANGRNQDSGSAESGLPYGCTFCSRRYAHQCQLRIHERVHTGEKPYQCGQCGKSFGQFCSLKRHRMVHTGERPFPCAHCGKQFSTSTNLKVHQSVHTGEKRFHCSKCGKNFSFLSNLIRHQTVHSTK